MNNIWEFLVQTMSVTLVAVFILFLKRLLEDKLSPRWQYAVWSILALRMLLPIDMSRYILFPVPLWLETRKGIIEKLLNSNYTRVYEPIRLEHIFPVIKSNPQSITDWLFVVYLAGVICLMLWYMISYVNLRILLKRGKKASEELQKKVKECPVVLVQGISSAFVCGVFHPILVLPAEKEVDEKILLHELLHLKYYDPLQSVFWCAFRCLHWCNPFLQYVFHQIGNDMESLCDQRVLEHLEGEERRAYGVILLEMANEKYARFPGTSSISNGGKNVAKRIQAIVRFKKYPKGMALVSMCIMVVLFVPVLIGNASERSQKDYQPYTTVQMEKAMAMTRLERCETIAGAIDTYAKGLLSENGIYIATASPLSKQEEIENELHQESFNDNNEAFYFLDSGEEFEGLYVYDKYEVYDITEITEKKYIAYLAFATEERNREDEEAHGDSIIIPIEVRYENGWVVEENGSRILSEYSPEEARFKEQVFSGTEMIKAKGKTGEVSVVQHSAYSVNNALPDTSGVRENSTSFDMVLKRDAEFSDRTLWNLIQYKYFEDEHGNFPKETVSMQCMEVYSEEDEIEFSTLKGTEEYTAGSSSSGGSWVSQPVSELQDGVIKCGGGHGVGGEKVEIVEFPKAYAIRIYWDNVMAEELIVQ